ncbi:uncharacterized protein LOC109807282 [Cajanus cajan]|uniref:uncharacterized protein LOC109807282 n=1 Tax=Cajanus cajan TaxID=3821 RepID=UPI00098DD258|nr:uncharacterized protein LOC109807282 [Cajanus cajan]
MAEKHLRELLQEEQEPFLLKHYISERRTHLKSPSTLTNKNKNKNKNLGFNKCLLSLHSATKSPLNAPLRPSNAKTATLLLEAALRIHKPKSKPNRAFRLGLFGSLFKKLTARKREIEARVVEPSCEVGLTCSCNARPSSAVWSESNDLETSSTDDSLEDIHFLNKHKQNNSHNLSFHHHTFFCHTPFRFSPQRSPDYSAPHTPDFSPSPPSPTRHTPQDKEMNGADGVNKFQSGEEEEDKEQCSPVSVLDPPFDDDDDDDDDGHENDHGEDGFDLDCSYANVQRTKLQLLDRLQRFEKLAELDPIELEKRMLDQEEEYETFIEDETCEEKVLREKVFEILCHARVNDMQQTPEDLKRLVYDLIMEEETQVNSSEERNMVIKRVCRRLELWKEVKSNTIDMMIQEDFSREEGMWKKNADQTREIALELEHAIFCFLVEELVC